MNLSNCSLNGGLRCSFTTWFQLTISFGKSMLLDVIKICWNSKLCCLVSGGLFFLFFFLFGPRTCPALPFIKAPRCIIPSQTWDILDQGYIAQPLVKENDTVVPRISQNNHVIILYDLLTEKKICHLLVHSDNLGPETGPSTHFQFATEIRVIGALGSVFLKREGER